VGRPIATQVRDMTEQEQEIEQEQEQEQKKETRFDAPIASPADDLPDDEAALIPLYEACRAANEALLAVYNKQHVEGDAANYIGGEYARMSDRACAVAGKLLRLKAIKQAWRDKYIEVLLSHVFFTGGSPDLALKTLNAVLALPVTKEPEQ
jgi:hypothetical protein